MTRAITTALMTLGLFLTTTAQAAPHWDRMKDDGCVSVGKRQVSSRLWDVHGDWRAACLATPARWKGRSLGQPRCDDHGWGGMWGVWTVPDLTCGTTARFGSLKDDGCTAPSIRTYSSRLHDTATPDWDAECKVTRARVDGANVLPDRCHNKGLFGEWGEWDVEDATCALHVTEKLVIVGGGSTPPDARQALLDLAGGAANARIVVIPTASSDADDPAEQDRFVRTWREAGAQSVVLLHTRDRTQADRADFVRPIQQANAVWMSGGMQTRLTEAYAGTRTQAAILELLQRGGVVGGSSAGAAVQSERMVSGDEVSPTVGDGFGLLKNVIIDQHYSERNREVRLRDALRRSAGFVGLGVDEDTALIVDGASARVVGGGTVTVMMPTVEGRPGRERRFPAGNTLRLQ